MAAWVLIPCLVKLRDEFNEIAPDRDKSSDGSIGDMAHVGGGTSDHLPDEDFPKLRDKDADSKNEVHAIDIDTDLRVPGLTLDQVVQHILSYCRRPSSDPLNEPRLRYIIWDRKIYRAPSWRAEVYSATGDPHTGHAHFSAEYDADLEADTSTWHLEDLVALTDEDIKRIWAFKGDNPYNDQVLPMSDFLRYAPSLAGITNSVDARLAPKFAALGVQVDQVDEAVWAKLPDPSISAGEKAAILRVLLGDDAAAVGALLAQPAPV